MGGLPELEPLRARYVGLGRPRATLEVDAATVAAQARAVLETSPVYFDVAAARAAGFAGVPAPPGFAFTIPYLAAMRRPRAEARADDDHVGELLALLAGPHGLVMHGEQAFTYARPLVAGDVVTGAETIVDVRRREATTPLTFVLTRTDWSDAAGALVVRADKTVVVRHGT